MAKKPHPLKSDALCLVLEALMPTGMLAALVRRKGETLPQILQRLDAALVQAVVENRIINEMTL